MLDGWETVRIACGELAGKERDSMLDGEETVEIACRDFAGRERDSMLDREETVQIACGELRWEGTRQHVGRIGNHGNRLRRASLGGSETACWTDRKPCKACGESFAGKVRDRMRGARRHAGRRGNRANSLRRASLLGGSETACWTDRKPWK